MKARAALTFAAASLVLGIAAPARADQCFGPLTTCVDADNLWLRPGPSNHLSLGSGLTTAPAQASFGLFVSYLSRPVVLVAPSADPANRKISVLDNMVDGSFLLSVGVTQRLELTLAAPVTFFEDGAGLSTLTGSGIALPRSTLRDPRFGFALAILPRPRKGSGDGFSLVSRFEVGVPLGDGDAFAGARTATAIPALTAQVVFGRFEGSAEVGARIRGADDFATAHWGTQLSFALGAGVTVWPAKKLVVGAEAFALPTLVGQDGAPTLVPAEWMLESSIAPLLGGDVSFTVAGGGAIPFNASTFTEPRFRFTGGIRYAPTGSDRDGDGIPDRSDKCPDVPEDHDGFKDDDGCPDPDNDGDGIPDKLDRCPDDAEDIDGFEDQDGCPDLDDDHDRVPDDVDQCRNQAEDHDGFEDEDGCPDLDNDHDGIPDTADSCPDAAEDLDGFRDDDGCPDLDNDRDGIPDDKDKCRDAPEDFDGFQDDDGCPDPDNDQDGIPDDKDRCKNEPETIDGNADDDGCPEPGAKSSVRWSQDKVEIDALGRFDAGKSKIPAALEKRLKMAAQLIRGRGADSLVIVEVFADKPGDKSRAAEDLAGARATAVRDLLAHEGIALDGITAVAGDPTAARSASSPTIEITVRARPARVAKPQASPAVKPANPKKE